MKRVRDKGRFYYGKEYTFRGALIRVTFFFAVCFLFYQGLNYLFVRTGEEQRKSLEEAIWRGITQCYAIEGRYPQSLEYLKQEYGVSYDSEEFFVDYQGLGANIMPDVTVIEKK